MNNAGRVTASVEATIEANADQVWNLLTDWGGFPMRAGMPGVVASELIGGANAVPRTRRITSANGGTADEELIHQDDLARRLYCRLVGEEVMGLRGYVATLFVDAVTDGRCSLTLQATCDIQDSAMVDGVKAAIETGWAEGLVAGVKRCLAPDGC